MNQVVAWKKCGNEIKYSGKESYNVIGKSKNATKQCNAINELQSIGVR